MRKNSSGNIFALLFGGVVLVGILGVAGMNLIVGPLTTSSQVTLHSRAVNDLMTNAKIVIMNTSVRAQMGDEDGDGFAEPAPFVPVGQNGCNITLPAGGLGGCLPDDIGAITVDPWGNQYAYCVWDNGTVTNSANRIAGEDNISATVIALISGGPNRRIETPCTAYDGNPATNDIVVNPEGIGDDLVRVYSYAMAQASSDGLWSLKDDAPDTAAIDKDIEIEGAFRMGFAGEGTGQVGASSCTEGSHIGRMRYNNTENTIEVCSFTENSYLWETMSGGSSVDMVEGDDIAMGPPEPEEDACITGPIGTACSDGAVYAGSVGGVRFYVSDKDEPAHLSWNNRSGQTATGATSLTDGMANTNILVELTDAGSPYAAAVACRSKGALWYLPSKEELDIIRRNRHLFGQIIPDTEAKYHWSSTESYTGMASARHLILGFETPQAKSFLQPVRCVRR